MTFNPKKYLFIKNCKLFKGLDNRLLDKFIEISILKNYKSKTMVCFEKNDVDGVYIVGTGSVKVYKISDTGQVYILKIAKAGDAVGEIAVFLSKTKFPAFAETLEETEIIFLPKLQLLKIVKKDAEISYYLLLQFAKIIKKFTQQSNKLVFKNVKERLLDYLVSLKKNNSDDFVILEMPKKTLAEILGTIPETVSRSLQKLKLENKIDFEKNNLQKIYFK